MSTRPSSPVAPRVRAQSIATTQPALAGRRTAQAVLDDAPRARPTLLVAADFGAGPGLRPAPWVLDGVAQATEASGMPTRSVVLGRDPGPNALADRLVAWGLPSADHSRDGTITLLPPGSRRGLRVPRHWVGNNLCLVLPALHRQQPRNASGPGWRGPIAAALVELAARWGRLRARDRVDQAARAVSEVFAHVSVIIDASWWAPLGVDDEGAPLLLAPQRVLGLRLDAPVTAAEAIDPAVVDGWLGQQLGLPLRRRGDSPRLCGPDASAAWPKLPRTHDTARRPRALSSGLAGQTVSALWQRKAPRPTRATALPTAVPGALADAWHDYRRESRKPEGAPPHKELRA